MSEDRPTLGYESPPPRSARTANSRVWVCAGLLSALVPVAVSGMVGWIYGSSLAARDGYAFRWPTLDDLDHPADTWFFLGLVFGVPICVGTAVLAFLFLLVSPDRRRLAWAAGALIGAMLVFFGVVGLILFE